MSNDTPTPADETQPVRPASGAGLPSAPAAEPAPAPTTTAPPAGEAETAPVARRGFRERFASLRRSDGDRGFGLAALIASALAGIIVGGLGFAAVHAITDEGGRDRGGLSQRRDDDDRGPGPLDMRGGPRGVPGQLPPTTLPEDDDSSTS